MCFICRGGRHDPNGFLSARNTFQITDYKDNKMGTNDFYIVIIFTHAGTRVRKYCIDLLRS
jgi:hypothetical protein